MVSRAIGAVADATVRMLVALGAPVAFAVVLLASLAAVSGRLPPRAADRDLEAIVVREQLRRSTTIRPRVLILGDSAALMGVDARRLGRELDEEVESLATLGWVGPAGYARLLERVARRTGPLKWVVVLMCGVSLALPEEQFAQAGYEQRVLEGGDTGERPVPRAARDRVYERLFSPLLDPPLPGRFGFYYGWPADIASSLEQGRGTLVDPGLGDASAPSPRYRFEVSRPVARRLGVLGQVLHAAAGRHLFGLLPLPQTAVGPDTEATRREVLTQVDQALELPPDSILDLPLALPSAQFATFTHVNARGREAYTALLAQALEERLGTTPAPAADRAR